MALKHTVSESLAATGSTTDQTFPSRQGSVAISGTWAGTVDIEQQLEDGTWRTMADGSFTANTDGKAFDNGSAMSVRATFTRTSGTAVVVITAENGRA